MSGARVALRASGLSEPMLPPRKEAAMLASPLPDLLLPISGERVMLTVYCLGVPSAIRMPIIRPIPAAL